MCVREGGGEILLNIGQLKSKYVYNVVILIAYICKFLFCKSIPKSNFLMAQCPLILYIWKLVSTIE